MNSLFKQSGGTYSVIGDYRIPNLILPDGPEYHINIWGHRRLNYLKQHKRILYTNLLTSGKLHEHLAEIDYKAQELFDELVREMTMRQGITEQLKAENQMEWVGRMNNIRFCAGEIVEKQIIYV